MLQCLLDMMMTADCFGVQSGYLHVFIYRQRITRTMQGSSEVKRYRTERRTQNNVLSYTEVNGCVYSLAEGVSEWTGGVEGTKLGKKKERSEWSEWRGERWVGKFSQLPATLLWIFRFNGLFFFFVLQRELEKKTNEPKIRQDHNVYNVLSSFQTHTCTSSSMTDLASKLNISKPTCAHTNSCKDAQKKRERTI